jgi:ElaB/YqjD/DUF883 family membrane-anchored ribosome-binding protein
MAKYDTKHAKAASAAMEEGLQDLIDSASELLEGLKDQQGAAVENLRARASDTIRSARRRLAAFRPDVQELATRTLQTTAKFVRRDPWRAVAIGALVVAALAIFTRQGDDDERDDDSDDRE